jgi:hypothetical protein
MNQFSNPQFWKITLGAVATIGLYSVLYRENKFYRFWEHVFLGLAAGWSIVTIWTETLYDKWWLKMTGTAAEGEVPAQLGYWPWVLLGFFGLMGYFVFSKKHNWMSRIPIGIILGLWSGQQVEVWWRTYGPQIQDSMRPVIATRTDTFFQPARIPLDDQTALIITQEMNEDMPDAPRVNLNQVLTISEQNRTDEEIKTLATQTGLPEEKVREVNVRANSAIKAAIGREVWISESINNLIFLFTLLSVLSYFLFSFEVKNRLLRGMNTSGRWLLMIGFGAIFGSTVMMRFTLLIDRMYFVWIEWLRDTVIRGFTGG